NWVRVYLPTRPNGLTGWIRRRAVRLLHNPYRIVVRLRRHRLELWKGTRRVLHARTVVGTPSTPTPVGMFYVVDLLKPPDPHGSYGPFTYDLSAHSNVLREFAGGDGHAATHGTNQHRQRRQHDRHARLHLPTHELTPTTATLSV